MRLLVSVVNGLILALSLAIAIPIVFAGPRTTSGRDVVGGAIIADCPNPGRDETKCLQGATNDCPATAHSYVCIPSTKGIQNIVICKADGEKRCKPPKCKEVFSATLLKDKCIKNTPQ